MLVVCAPQHMSSHSEDDLLPILISMFQSSGCGEQAASIDAMQRLPL
jgi:hypothetical protein